MENNTMSSSMAFDKKLIKLGMCTVAFAIVANFAPAVYLWLVHGIVPAPTEILKIWGVAATAYAVSWVVQPIAYFGVLGASGSYIGWLAGSVSTIRLPSATMAQKVANAEAGTHEGDVMATIGTASSVLVSVAFVTVFTFIGAQVIPFFPTFILEGFGYIMPAIFAGIYVQMAMKDIRTGIAGLLVGVVLTVIGILAGAPSWLMTIIIVFSGVVVNRVFYVYDRKKAA